jgi:chromosome segregation ATPase
MNLDEKVVDFVKNASKKPKSVGHNKYQVIIENLNNELNTKTMNIKALEEEIQLYKNNITTVQMQLQEKLLQNNDLTTNLREALSLIEDFKSRLIELDTSTSMTIRTTQEENDILKLTNKDLIDLISTTTNKHEIEMKQYLELVDNHKTAMCVIEKKTKDHETLNKNFQEVSKEHCLYKSETEKLQDELKTLRHQVQNYRNENSILRTQIFEKDYLLKKVNNKKEETECENETANESETNVDVVNTEIEQPPPAVTIKVRRGLNSRRT